MFDIGLQELVVIFVIALLVFGPKNLPQLGRSLGRAMREFRRASEEFRTTVETNLEMNAPDPVISPMPEPGDAQPTGAAAVTTPEPPGGAAPDAEKPVQAGAASEEPSGEPYLAQRGGRLFHTRDCGWARRVAEPERVYFKRVAEAREAALVACPTCDPWEPE